MNRLNGLRTRRTTLRGLVVALLVAAVLMAGNLVSPQISEARGGTLSPWISAYYNTYDMRVYVYGGGFTPGATVEVNINVDNYFFASQYTTASSPYGEIFVSFGPYCPQHISIKAVDKTGRNASYTFTTYDCPW